MWELPSLSGVLSGVGTRLEHSWMSTQMPAGQLWFPQIPGFELPSSMYVLLPPDGSHVVRRSPVQTNMQRPLQVHVVGTLPSPGIFKPAMLLVLGDCDPRAIEQRVAPKLGRTPPPNPCSGMWSRSGPLSSTYVSSCHRGVWRGKYDMLTLCAEYLTQRSLNPHFWSLETRTTGCRNGSMRPFPSSTAVARRQRTSIECSWVYTYV